MTCYEYCFALLEELVEKHSLRIFIQLNQSFCDRCKIWLRDIFRNINFPDIINLKQCLFRGRPASEHGVYVRGPT